MIGLLSTCTLAMTCPSGGIPAIQGMCPSLTEAEFNTLLSVTQVQMQNGVTKAEQLQSIANGCANTTGVFDTISECESCTRAIVDFVYGP